MHGNEKRYVQWSGRLGVRKGYCSQEEYTGTRNTGEAKCIGNVLLFKLDVENMRFFNCYHSLHLSVNLK